VLQVVQGSYATETTSNSSTYIDTGLAATITPSSSSSKIIVVVSHPSNFKSADVPHNQLGVKIFRGSSEIHASAGMGYNGVSAIGLFSYSMTILDSPSTSAAVTYKTQFCSAYGTASVKVQSGGITSTMILVEVAP
jgi:hypothetical protein